MLCQYKQICVGKIRHILSFKHAVRKSRNRFLEQRQWQDRLCSVNFQARIFKVEFSSSLVLILSVAVGQQVSNPVNSCQEKNPLQEKCMTLGA